MLTHLEICGFKSFPDRIRLDFVPGITGIVGPNGSGKSNVVDAIRWALGEQSARSMRGEGMGDVLFKGSVSRRPVQVAEVTLVLDNSSARFAADIPEIRVTRRLSRQGQSEYLINGASCRLKDIKDLFLGSGAGSDSFCVIQQGQVAALLQASPVERRALFEEAAGVSRYKASREECRRKLDRVDDHLRRLSDLKDELDRRVQSARLQAAKAVKWQEIQNQLREAKISQLTRQWREAQASLIGIKAQMEVLDIENGIATSDQATSNLSELQESAARFEAELRDAEKTESALRQGLAVSQGRIEREFQVLETANRERSRALERIQRAHCRLAACKVALDAETLALDETGAEIDRLALLAAGHDLEIRRLSEDLEKNKAILEGVLKTQSQNNTELSLLEAELNSTQAEMAKNRKVIAESRRSKSIADLELEEGTRALSNLLSEFEGLSRQIEGAKAGLRAEVEAKDGYQAAVDHLTRRIYDLQIEKNGLLGRKEVLEGLERSHEGFGAGVREIINQWQSDPVGRWRTVQGLLADHLKVRREYAPLIELALGERSHRVLALDSNAIRFGLATISKSLLGRVGFIFSSGAFEDDEESFITPPNHQGIVARAANLARCDHPRFPDLPERLLGRVLIVKNLEVALEIQPKAPGYTIVTLAGEMIDPDGGLTTGPVVVEAGVLSRKAELREVRDRLAQIDISLRDLEKESTSQAALLISAKERVETLEKDLDLIVEREQLKIKSINEAKKYVAELETQSVEGARDERDAIARLATLLIEVARLELEKAVLNARLAETAETATETGRSTEMAETGVRQAENKAIEAKTHLAEKQNAFNQALNRHKDRSEEWESLASELEREETECRMELIRQRKQTQTMMEMLGSFPDWHLKYVEASKLHEKALCSYNSSRQVLVEAVHSQSGINEDRDQRLQMRQSLEIEITRLEIKIEDMIRRSKEEFDIDLNHESATRHQSLEMNDQGTMFEELQRQAQRLGVVNPEAPRELSELLQRQATFNSQILDLQSAKKSLLDLIDEANSEGSTRFMSVFQAVSGHFRELFRKLFGGGQADLSLLDRANPLDCGIEVIARPPGKDASNLTLMSGGERTMTAVALLMAVFKSCPSPFCVLDEVDAALDEGNVGRFTDLIKEFSERTQFIMITHHKRSMACADVLLGITMSEPGTSTRIAVRMEDWVQDGGAQKAA